MIPAWVSAGAVYAHCEIPCGIYDDEARFDLIDEDILTLEKGMNQITLLSQDPAANMNQIVRWVQNKEEHADRIKETISEYFLSQRIQKPAMEDSAAYNRYLDELRLLHEMTVAAMQAKQTTDLQYVASLRALLGEFRNLYLTRHDVPQTEQTKKESLPAVPSQ